MERLPTEEVELQDVCGNQLSPASEGNVEQQQESKYTELSYKVCSRSLQQPHPQSYCCEHACQCYVPEYQSCHEQGKAGSACEDVSSDSREVVELPAEVNELRELQKCRGSSPTPKPVARLSRQKEVEHPSILIRKVLMKQNKAMSSTFYTSIGYTMQIQFRCSSSKGHHSKVNVYIYTRPGKNDKALSWPLRGKVQILSINLGGDTHHASEIPGTWEKPGACYKGELDTPYEELPEYKNGMLKFCVQVILD